MSLVDHRNRKIVVGDRVRIEQNIPSENGMLYKNAIVKIDELNTKTNKIRVTDSLGKVWWVDPLHVSSSFL